MNTRDMIRRLSRTKRYRVVHRQEVVLPDWPTRRVGEAQRPAVWSLVYIVGPGVSRVVLSGWSDYMPKLEAALAGLGRDQLHLELLMNL